MELRHLRYFIAAAEEENISRAALKLHVSQPALSRQIRDLEEEIGFILFERGAKSLRLSEAGRVFLKEAGVVLAMAERAVEKARAAATGSAELNVGYAPSLTPRLLPAALRRFQAALPKVRVKLHDLSTGEMLRGLREGALQIAFLAQAPTAALRGLRFQELIRERICVAMQRDHPLASQRQITLARAADEPLLGYNRKDYPDAYGHLVRLLATRKRKPRIAAEHDSVSSLIAAVESGAGVALVPESLSCVAGPRLKMVPLFPEPDPLRIGAAWSPERFPAQAQTFLDCAREVSFRQGKSVTGG